MEDWKNNFHSCWGICFWRRVIWLHRSASTCARTTSLYFFPSDNCRSGRRNWLTSTIVRMSMIDGRTVPMHFHSSSICVLLTTCWGNHHFVQTAQCLFSKTTGLFYKWLALVDECVVQELRRSMQWMWYIETWSLKPSCNQLLMPVREYPAVPDLQTWLGWVYSISQGGISAEGISPKIQVALDFSWFYFART